jgi:hypothetical protein
MVLLFAPTRCRPVGGSLEACGKMNSNPPKSTKKLKLFCVSRRKIKFSAGWKDIAVTDADTMGGEGVVSRGAGSGGGGCHCQPSHFSDMCSQCCTSGQLHQSGCGGDTNHGRP